MRSIGIVVVLALVACSDRPAGDTGGTTDATTTSVTPSTGLDPSADGPSSTSTAATTVVDTTADSLDVSDSESSTGESECVQGVFRGRYFSGFEWTYLDICDGPSPWTEVGTIDVCNDVWVVIDGTLCGPGAYGHLGGYDYFLSGTVVEGPCLEGTCDGELLGCGTVAGICGGTAECYWPEQDCPAGEKCIPTSQAGVPPWMSTECVPIPPGAVGLGEACTTGTESDNCDLGLFCWNEDPLAPDGTCVTLCEPTDAPCPGPRQCTDCAGNIAQVGDADLGMCLPDDCGGRACTC